MAGCGPCQKKPWMVRWSDGTVTFFKTETGAQAAVRVDPRDGKVSRR